MAVTAGFTSCDSYLDKLPDNRMELSSPDDVSKLLVSAYSSVSPVYLLEMYSDNTNEYNNTAWTSANRFQDQAYGWKDITETDNESPTNIWDENYNVVRTCNEAIGFIESQADQSQYSAQLGEALVARAWAEYTLSTVFCRAYNPQTAGQELGLPYPTEPDYSLLVNYERGTLAELYDKIDKDLQRGLPLLTNTYDNPKFHFTPSAANAFAARFYLNYQKYDEAIKCANVVLGSNPATRLRDWAAWNALSANYQVQPNAYVSSSSDANLLLQVSYSLWGAIGGPYSWGKKYAHGERLSSMETIQSTGPWGKTETMAGFKVFYNTSLSNYCLRKIPFMQEFSSDHSSYLPHSEFAVLTTDETLLARAEAYALKGEYDLALADINTELSKFMPKAAPLTIEGIKEFYDGRINAAGKRVGGLDYYTPQDPTIKRELHPQGFTLERETQNPLIQTILQLRRVLTIHEGRRMQDVKRYGITIYRLRLNESNELEAVTDSINANDPRSAIQLPVEVLSAGMTPNPRNTTNK
mgnify:CR=1 FL=1